MKKLRILAFIHFVSLAAFAIRQPPYIGEDTALRKVFKRVDLPYELIYTSSTSAIMIRVYSRPVDAYLKAGTDDPCCTWLSRLQFTDDLTKDEIAVVRRSHFTLVTRKDDGVTCIVNELNGSRIWVETRLQQNETAVEKPCAAIWAISEILAAVPARDRLTIEGLLTRPARKPTNPDRKPDEAPSH
jgi:hypothetical protein